MQNSQRLCQPGLSTKERGKEGEKWGWTEGKGNIYQMLILSQAFTTIILKAWILSLAIIFSIIFLQVPSTFYSFSRNHLPILV